MTEPFHLINAPDSDRDMSDALRQLEKAFADLEKILHKNAGNIEILQKLGDKNGSFAGLGFAGLRGLVDIMAGGTAAGGIKLPDIQTKNRFPSPSGQLLADLAAALSRLAGRNL